MNLKTIGEGVVATILVTCTLIVTGVVVKREFFDVPLGGAGVMPQPREVSDWERYGVAGSWLHRSDSAVVPIVVFSDFQCPFCARLVPILDSLVRESSAAVSIRYRHLPLETIHPHARTAARATVCADQVGRFRELHDAFFAEPAQLGTRTWAIWARQVGIVDTANFKSCMEDPATDSVVAADIAAGTSLDIRGTPAILVRDELLTGFVPLAVLQAKVEN